MNNLLKNILRLFLNFFDYNNDVKDIVFFDNEMDKHLDVIEKHGLKAQFYYPSIEGNKDKELCESLKILNHRGYIVSDKNNMIVGVICDSRLSTEERAKQRRSEFKIVSENH